MDVFSILADTIDREWIARKMTQRRGRKRRLKSRNGTAAKLTADDRESGGDQTDR